MEEKNVLALVTANGQQHIFIYDGTKESFDALLQILRNYAAKPSLGLSWTQATLLLVTACDRRAAQLFHDSQCQGKS